MQITQASSIVSEWAKEKAQIKKVLFFGSRVKGTELPDTDIDVAIQLNPNIDESGGLATWMNCCDEWRSELSELLPYKVQMEWDNGRGTRVIEKGLSEASLLVYEKKI